MTYLIRSQSGLNLGVNFEVLHRALCVGHAAVWRSLLQYQYARLQPPHLSSSPAAKLHLQTLHRCIWPRGAGAIGRFHRSHEK
jgi:hypothetical protein